MRRMHQADSFVRRVATERLVQHRERSGFMMLQKLEGTNLASSTRQVEVRPFLERCGHRRR